MKRFAIGVAVGWLTLAVLGWVLMPRMGPFFFVEDASRFPFEETVERVRAQASAHAPWHVLQEKDYNEAYRKRGVGELPFRLVEFKLGNPDHAHRVTVANPAVCTFMPASIAVVGWPDGRVSIYRKNTALMGRMFPGDVGRIMSREVPADLDAMLKDVVQGM